MLKYLLLGMSLGGLANCVFNKWSNDLGMACMVGAIIAVLWILASGGDR